MLSFTRPKKVIGIDLGTHSVKAIQVSKHGKKVLVEEVGYAEIDMELAHSDPTKAQTSAILSALSGLAVKQSLIVTALPGNTAVVRYPKITIKSNETLAQAVQREAAPHIPFDLNEVYLSWDLISEERGEKTNQAQIILVAAKNDAINNRLNIFQACDIQCSVFDIDSIAVLNALERINLLKPEESAAIFDIGYSSSSIHFVRDRKSIFIRDLLWGAKDILDAITKERRCDPKKAEDELIKASKEIFSKVETHEIPGAEPHEEIEDAVSETVSPLEPLDDELVLDATPIEETTIFREKPIQEIIMPSLNRMVSEVRRSFEFFEHQLYEKPVQRIILCGGVSCYPLIGETLVREFNVDTVELVELTGSEILFSNSPSLKPFKEHSAKFTVAFGMAVRGLTEI